MSNSIADYLRVVRPHLDPVLISAEALSRIYAIAQTLPPFSGSFLECRLGQEPSTSDFLVWIASMSDWQILANQHTTFRLPEAMRADPVWQRLSGFCDRWLHSPLDSDLRRAIEWLGLEFDANGILERDRIPSLFFRLSNPKNSQDHRVRNHSITETTLTLLLGHGLCPQVQQKIATCFYSLPLPAQITFVGVMLSRQAQGARLNVSGLVGDSLSQYLSDLQWEGSIKALQDLTSELSNFTDQLVLTFDVGEVVSPRIGIECFFHYQPQQDPRHLAFLDFLVTRQLCTPEKREALLSWSGTSALASDSDDYPSNLATLSNLFGSRVSCVFRRTLNHIKLVYHPGKPLEAKAYLFYMPQLQS